MDTTVHLRVLLIASACLARKNMNPFTVPLGREALENLAQRRAKAKMGWYIHAMVFLVVNTVIFSVLHYSFGSQSWSVYQLLGWGLGLALHGILVFALRTGSDLRERLVQKERERLQRERSEN